MIDLHCHSYFSDGALSPEALIYKAINAQVRILALTDHDTIEGLAPLHAAAEQHGIQIINGIELSVRWRKYDIHVLGLNIMPDDMNLSVLIQRQNESRIIRAEKIGELLMQCGVTDAYEKACIVAGHRRVGRPHFAQVLINEGIVKDMKTAFKRFLGQGRAAYAPTLWLTMDDAVQGIVSAGGQAVIAHPLKYKLTRSKLHELVQDFKLAGGEGIEVVSGETTVTQIKELAGICLRFNLLASSGSDFHSDTASRVGLGRQQSLPLNCVPVWEKWTKGIHV